MKLGSEFKKSQPEQFTHHQKREEEINPFQKQLADDFSKKLREQAVNVIKNAKGSKNVQQQIRLICNLITPDNFEKKFQELREHVFGDIKMQSEKGYTAAQGILTEKLNQQSMKIFGRYFTLILIVLHLL